jgi:hypothetical protein
MFPNPQHQFQRNKKNTNERKEPTVGRRPILRKYLFLEGKTQFWRRTTGRKSSTCEGKPHAKEESMQGTQAGKPNHVRVRVLVRDCNN